jgi:long-chain acyl-CoA synthetase
MLEISTINDLFGQMSHRGDETVVLWQTGGEWKPISSQGMYGRVRAVVQLLRRWGIQRGDRVAIVSENRWEWPVTDFAVLAMGGVDVPMYSSLTGEQMGFVLRDCGAKAVFLSNKVQYAKLLKAGELPELQHVCVFDDGEFGTAESFAEAMQAAAGLEQPDAGFDALLREVRPEELASIIYTSGTTGDPKGVMLTHRNLADNLRHSTDDLHIGPGDVAISFLPLGHSLARHLDYAMYGNGAVVAYLPKFDNLVAAMKQVRPTVFLAVPRVFEKVRQATEHKATGLRAKILNWAVGVGRRHQKTLVAGKEPFGLQWKLADKLVFSKLREAFGGRAKLYVSGGAPLGKDSAEWFLAVGIRIMEGYGMTETSPVISRNTFAHYRMGTVGEVVQNMETRIAEDGELEVRGTSVFAGYWGKEEATKKEFTEDGWFKTGDIGKLEDGFLSITDRKKELIKTSGGKYIAPQPIEGKLKVDALVGNAAVIGDTKKFASVLISPDFPALERWATQNGVATADKAALVRDPKVQKQYEAIVKKVNVGLEHHEVIKRVSVVAEMWDVESGELTPSMKLKRRVIVERYKDRIAEMYRE